MRGSHDKGGEGSKGGVLEAGDTAMGACRDENIKGGGHTAHSDSVEASQVPGGRDSKAYIASGSINRRASKRDGCGCALRVFVLASVYERADLEIKSIIVAGSPMLADLR
jgi:hypothetical protein